MEKLISCAFNIDTACVELHFTDGEHLLHKLHRRGERGGGQRCVRSDCITSYDKKKLPEMPDYYESKGCSVQTLDETMQF